MTLSPAVNTGREHWGTISAVAVIILMYPVFARVLVNPILSSWQSSAGSFHAALTLVVGVVVLVHLPFHVRVRMRV